MLTLPPELSASHMQTLQNSLGFRNDQVSTSIADRISYAHDASPVALKDAPRGVLNHVPAAVIWPETSKDVSALLRWATDNHIPVTPFGSGSGIVGAALADPKGITVDMKRMDQFLMIDGISQTVDVQTGINGQILEDKLNQQGWTLGHFPQSIRASTLGGWLAHRAAGVASTRYGKIEDLVESLEVVLPTGEIVQTRNVPRSSTGPDLNQLFVGAEGTLGIVTEATLSIRPRPKVRRWQSYAYPAIEEGIDAIRRVLQEDYRPAIVRLYDAEEARPLLKDEDLPDNFVVLLWGSDGSERLVDFEMEGIRRLCKVSGAIDLGEGPAFRWWEHRLSTAGLLETINKPNSIADALEISGSWSSLAHIYHAMRHEMLAVAGSGARVYGHVSHAYHTGANLYMIFHVTADSIVEVPDLYNRVLDAAFNACLRLGGSLSHHHGVGATKAKWLGTEHGSDLLELIHRIQQTIDPSGIMNPGVGLHRGMRHED